MYYLKLYWISRKSINVTEQPWQFRHEHEHSSLGYQVFHHMVCRCEQLQTDVMGITTPNERKGGKCLCPQPMDSSWEKMQYLDSLHGGDCLIALVTSLPWGSPLCWPCGQPTEDYNSAASSERRTTAVHLKGTTAYQWQLQLPVLSPSGCAMLPEKE